MNQKEITPIQCRDTALAFIFISLLFWIFSKNEYCIYVAIGLTFLTMLFPSSMKYPAKLWFCISHVIGSFMSKVLLTLIYIVILLPVAYVRRMFVKDSLRLHSYGSKESSVFVVREHHFTKNDLKHPF